MRESAREVRRYQAVARSSACRSRRRRRRGLVGSSSSVSFELFSLCPDTAPAYQLPAKTCASVFSQCRSVTVFLYVAQLRLLSCASEHVSNVSDVPNVTRWIGSKHTIIEALNTTHRPHTSSHKLCTNTRFVDYMCIVRRGRECETTYLH